MMDLHHLRAAFPRRPLALAVHIVRVLAFGFGLLASILVAPLVHAVHMRRRHSEPALAPRDLPISTAAAQDRIEEAGVLAELGLGALHRRRFALAEARFRHAIALLAADNLPYLQATLRHHLAIALHGQCKDKEAEGHAAVALAFHRDPRSRLAIEGRVLLADIRARRVSQPAETNAVTPHEHRTTEKP